RGFVPTSHPIPLRVVGAADRERSLTAPHADQLKTKSLVTDEASRALVRLHEEHGDDEVARGHRLNIAGDTLDLLKRPLHPEIRPRLGFAIRSWLREIVHGDSEKVPGDLTEGPFDDFHFPEALDDTFEARDDLASLVS